MRGRGALDVLRARPAPIRPGAFDSPLNVHTRSLPPKKLTVPVRACRPCRSRAALRVAIKCIEGVFNTTVDAKRTLREVSARSASRPRCTVVRSSVSDPPCAPPPSTTVQLSILRQCSHPYIVECRCVSYACFSASSSANPRALRDHSRVPPPGSGCASSRRTRRTSATCGSF